MIKQFPTDIQQIEPLGVLNIKDIVKLNRLLSLGGHVDSQENKKLCFCTASLALNTRLVEACRAKTKLFIPPRLNMAAV